MLSCVADSERANGGAFVPSVRADAGEASARALPAAPRALAAGGTATTRSHRAAHQGDVHT